MEDPTTSKEAPRTKKTGQRVLSCLKCQQRKIKCNRTFPCLNCLRSGDASKCAPATLMPRRKTRDLVNAELITRLRTYEELLAKNDIAFEPITASPSAGDSNTLSPESDASVLDPDIKSGTGFGSKNIWHVLSKNESSDDEDEDTIEQARLEARREVEAQSGEMDSHLLFGFSGVADLSTLHPEPVFVLKLWQIYLDRVNPLLKITHTPTLQPRIIQAISNLANFEDRVLEALMFGIYCISISTMSDVECLEIFGITRSALLLQFQYGCQHALSRACILRTTDIDCLAAYLLYLISLRDATVGDALSPILGVAVRIAQKMHIHQESATTKDDTDCFELERRRRLWWALILFDQRISELVFSKVDSVMNPTWNCGVPSNTSDSDLRPGMKQLPQNQPSSVSEAFFVTVRCEMFDWLRSSKFHLSYQNSSLKGLISNSKLVNTFPGCSEIESIRNTLEAKYLSRVDLENPLAFLTVWSVRGYLAKCRLVELYLLPTDESTHIVGANLAIEMLRISTRIMTSPAVSDFVWLLHAHFPFLAYKHLVTALRSGKLDETMRKEVWDIMSDDFHHWIGPKFSTPNPIFHFFKTVVLQTWEEERARRITSCGAEDTPGIIIAIRIMVGQSEHTDQMNLEPVSSNGQINMEDLLQSVDGLDSGEFDMDAGLFNEANTLASMEGPTLQPTYSGNTANLWSTGQSATFGQWH